MYDSIKEYDENGRCSHVKWNYGYEVWYKYNNEGNIIYKRDSDGKEMWFYDNGQIKQIRYNRTGYEAYYQYDKYGKIISMIDN